MECSNCTRPGGGPESNLVSLMFGVSAKRRVNLHEKRCRWRRERARRYDSLADSLQAAHTADVQGEAPFPHGRVAVRQFEYVTGSYRFAPLVPHGQINGSGSVCY